MLKDLYKEYIHQQELYKNMYQTSAYNLQIMALYGANNPDNKLFELVRQVKEMSYKKYKHYSKLIQDMDR